MVLAATLLGSRAKRVTALADDDLGLAFGAPAPRRVLHHNLAAGAQDSPPDIGDARQDACKGRRRTILRRQTRDGPLHGTIRSCPDRCGQHRPLRR
jgi:hypothetical protein